MNRPSYITRRKLDDFLRNDPEHTMSTSAQKMADEFNRANPESESVSRATVSKIRNAGGLRRSYPAAAVKPVERLDNGTLRKMQSADKWLAKRVGKLFGEIDELKAANVALHKRLSVLEGEESLGDYLGGEPLHSEEDVLQIPHPPLRDA